MTFTGTQTQRQVTIDVNGDTLDEPDEDFFVNLSGGSNGNITDTQGKGTINDDDPTPSLSIDDVTVTEGDSGTTDANFKVALSEASGRQVTVDFATANGSATAPSDYGATSGTLTFAPGQTEKPVAVAVKGDTAVEADESYSVGLSNASNATISALERGQSGNDLLFGGPGDDRLFGKAATMTGAPTRGGTASSADRPWTSTEAAPDPTASPAASTNRARGNETGLGAPMLGLGSAAEELASAHGAHLHHGGRAAAAGRSSTTTCATTAAALALDRRHALREGDAGSREARLTVSLSRPSQSEVTVDYATEDGSAREPSDYSKRGGTLSFAPGQTRKVVGVPVRGDKRAEPNEAFLVELSDPRGAAIGDGRGRVTIRDDDEPPPPSSSETRCAGVRATILGSSRGETIIGTYRDDVIVARGGDDRVRGGAGQDLVCGGGGEDELSGGSGHDRLYGQAGNDLLRGQSGHDLLFGGPGDDRLFGDSGGEDGRGNSGEDSLFGGSGNDSLFGGPAVDACRGSSGPDSQSGCER